MVCMVILFLGLTAQSAPAFPLIPIIQIRHRQAMESRLAQTLHLLQKTKDGVLMIHFLPFFIQGLDVIEALETPWQVLNVATMPLAVLSSLAQTISIPLMGVLPMGRVNLVFAELLVTLPSMLFRHAAKNWEEYLSDLAPCTPKFIVVSMQGFHYSYIALFTVDYLWRSTAL